MKRSMMTLLAGLSLAALVAGGCANKEAVKSEEPVPIAAKAPETAQPETARPEASAPVQQPVTPSDENKIVAANTAETPDASASTSANLQTVYFDFDRSDLRQDARDILSRNADTLLKSKRGVNITIEGHCDERGSAEYNLALGERRAKSVQQYLLTLGVQPERLSVISYGKEKPAVQGNDEAAWAKNRRAEFVLAR